MSEAIQIKRFIVTDPISNRQVFVDSEAIFYDEYSGFDDAQEYVFDKVDEMTDGDGFDENQFNDSERIFIIEETVAADDLDAIRNRASVSEVINFANELRKAGGANNFIQDLVPSIPTDASSCLIANALNFNCEVNADSEQWYMTIDTDNEYRWEIAENINHVLGLENDIENWDEDDRHYASVTIYLPEEIGLVAKAFDSFADVELENFNINNHED